MISRVISRVTILRTHIRGLITPLKATLNPNPYKPYRALKGTPITPLKTSPEPPSKGFKPGAWTSGVQALEGFRSRVDGF